MHHGYARSCPHCLPTSKQTDVTDAYPILEEIHSQTHYSKVYNYLDTVGRGYKPRQRGWGGAATLQNVNLFLDFTITQNLRKRDPCGRQATMNTVSAVTHP